MSLRRDVFLHKRKMQKSSKIKSEESNIVQ